MANELLYELVHSLTVDEKRYFRKKAAGTNYLELFDIIEKLPVYVEASVKAKISNPVYAKNLSFGKNYLYNQILDALRVMHNGTKPVPHPLITVSEYWSNLQIFLEKGLINQSFKLIAKAKKHCRIYHLGPDSLKFMFVERSLVSRYENKGALKKLDQIHADCLEIKRHLDMELDLFQVYERIFVQYKYNRQDNPALFKALADGMDFLDKNQSYFSKNPSFNAQVYAHFCKAQKAETSKDPADACREFGAILELYDKDQRVKMANLERYLAVLKNYFNNLMLTATWFSPRDLKKLLNGVQTLEAKNLKTKINIEHVKLYTQLLYFLYVKEYERAASLEKPIKSFLARYGDKTPTDAHLILHYNLGLALIMTGLKFPAQKERRLDDSLNWLNPIENHPKADTQSYVYTMTKVLQTIVHFELGAHDLAFNRSRAMLLHLREQKKNASVEYVILSTVKKVIQAKIPEKKRELFELLRVKLNAFHGTAQILFWVDQKIKQFS